MITRRQLLSTGAAVGGVLLAAKRAGAQDHQHDHGAKPPAEPGDHAAHGGHAGHGNPGKPVPVRKGPRPKPDGWIDTGTVVTPNGARLPWKVVGGVKVFHLVAEPIVHEIVPGLTIEAWGYNGRTPGPTIEVTEGDRCRFYVTNRLPEDTTIHWHGVILPNGMDGVGGLTQPSIPPGETFTYEFTFGKPGTFMYHPHFDEMVQIALGMQGMIVVHPRTGRRAPRDYALMLQEWRIEAGTYRPDPLAMDDFNILTINSVAFPKTAPLVAQRGETMRVRLGNMSPMDHHPIHIHGHKMEVVETDGGAVPKSARWPETTVLVPVGSVRVIEFLADNPGDWPFHCHMTHHIMNQMGHESGNLIGADLADADKRIRKIIPGYMTMGQTGMGEMGQMKMPMPENSVPMLGAPGPFGHIDMGGMFTIIKIRDRLGPGAEDPGWYAHPEGTVSAPATKGQIEKDGIDLDLD